jgi:hypothetical protein
LGTHDGQVEERLTYGHVPVKGHGHKQHHLHTTYDVDEEDLSDAASKDHFALSEKITNHLGGGKRAGSQVNEGETGQQEVHGGV